MGNDRIPFPQADDFEKVFAILNVQDESMLKNMQLMSSYLGEISERQVSYYLSAAMYIGIISKDKTFTELGNVIRSESSSMQRIELIRLIVSDRVFGKTFFCEKVLGIQMGKEDVAELIKVEFPEYSDAMFERRAQTVMAWVSWINKQLD